MKQLSNRDIVIPGRRGAANPEPRGQGRGSCPWVPDRAYRASGMTRSLRQLYVGVRP
jgi:hypothetical protein